MTSNRVRVLSLVVEDHPGVLERVASQIRRRGFNIQSLTVGPVSAGKSRMTVTVDAGHAEVDQVAKQVDKLSKQLYIQSKSFDEVFNLVKNKSPNLHNSYPPSYSLRL